MRRGENAAARGADPLGTVLAAIAYVLAMEGKEAGSQGHLSGAKDALTGAASKAVSSGQQVGRLEDTVERNPLGLAVGAAAVGFVAGS
jgi:ElaB/YqjD/DUF883 family membrane-anchored ribosome-binding protein